MSKIHDALTSNRACPHTRAVLEDFELQQGWQPIRIGAMLSHTHDPCDSTAIDVSDADTHAYAYDAAGADDADDADDASDANDAADASDATYSIPFKTANLRLDQ